MNRIIGTTALAWFYCHAAFAGYPGDSIYNLDSLWQNQHSESVELSDLAGHKVVVSMTYTSCQHTCPTIVSNMQAIEKRLSPASREKVKFVLVSLLPEIDTPKILKAYADKRELQGWILLTGDATDVRSLAMVLNVQYRPAGKNEVSHSNLITILDPQGRVNSRITGLGSNAEPVIDYLN